PTVSWFLLPVCVHLLCSLLQNVAWKKEAVQSSQGNWAAAGRAVDGNTDGRFHKGSCTSTEEESDPWWRVDLQNAYKINAITITQSDSSENLLIGGEIWIGNSIEANDTKNVRCAVIADIPAGLTFHFSFNAIEGRYVTVRLPGVLKTLRLCEVEVFPTDYVHPLPNVAMKGGAAQSSTLPFAAASRAVDGRRDSFYSAGFCSHTAENEAGPWWRVDLRRTHIVRFVKVTNRGDCCAERLDGAEIRIGNSLENNGNNNPRCASISHIRAGKTNTYHCAGGSMDGRFVNVVIPGERKTLTLCEVEVYATPTGTTPSDLTY
uniref:Fucolectin tachylectin-4 pentraxin-1 domain-containing protein n=1 Tax=Cyclopterus lumpus TaxID=8103 RepID=A0A8C2XS97_CYCLU